MRGHAIGPFRLDPSARVLTRDGATVALGPRAIAVLAILVQSAPEFVSKERLIRGAWPDVIVEDNNLPVKIAAIRRELARVPGGERWIETLSRRGYRFVGPVVATPDGPVRDARSLSPTKLFEPLTSFVGRTRELAEVRELLARSRLVTLTGAGGVGKTRLALRIAAELNEAFSDGVSVVEMSALLDPQRLPRLVADALGLEEQPGAAPTKTVTAHLAHRNLLLLLDNAEHLLPGCAQFAEEVLRHCPRVVLLLTSRERLGLMGESTYRVPSLATPESARDGTALALKDCESIQLFGDRAQLLMPQFSVTDANASALASICRRMDGIPLAIELAAARVRSMTVQELDQRLDDGFRVLVGGARTAPRRQQTLRAAIDWSYDLLTPSEQALLARLAVFSGGWTLEAAEAVCSGPGCDAWEVLELLTSLIDKSLVFAIERNGATRYGLLEIVRQYAWKRLAQQSDAAHWQQRHLAHFVSVAQAIGQLPPRGQQAWLDRLDVEHDNVRAALRWAAGRGADPSGALRLAAAAFGFWSVRGHYREGREWLAVVLAATSGETASGDRAKALHGAASLAERQGDFAAARALEEESLSIWRALGDRNGIANSLNQLGVVTGDQSDFAAARRYYEECLAIRKALDDPRGVARVLNGLANLACMQADYGSARHLHEEGLALNRQLADRRSIAISLVNLGDLADAQGDRAGARALYEECLPLFRELGDRAGAASVLANLGVVTIAEGDVSTAQKLFDESLAIFVELDARREMAFALEGLAEVALACDRSVKAVRLWSAVERLRREIGNPRAPNERPRHEKLLAAARAQIGGGVAFDAAWQEGQAMSRQAAIDLARSDADS